MPSPLQYQPFGGNPAVLTLLSYLMKQQPRQQAKPSPAGTILKTAGKLATSKAGQNAISSLFGSGGSSAAMSTPIDAGFSSGMTAFPGLESLVSGSSASSGLAGTEAANAAWNAGASAAGGGLPAAGLSPLMGLGAVASVPLVGMALKKGLQKAFGRSPSTFQYDPAKFIETEKQHLASGRNDSTGWMKLRDQDPNWLNRSDQEKTGILDTAKALKLLVAGGHDQPDVSFGINWEKFKPSGDSAANNRPVTRADIERGLQYNPISRTTTQIKNLPDVLKLWDQIHGSPQPSQPANPGPSIDPGRMVNTLPARVQALPGTNLADVARNSFMYNNVIPRKR